MAYSIFLLKYYSIYDLFQINQGIWNRFLMTIFTQKFKQDLGIYWGLYLSIANEGEDQESQ